MPLAAWPVTAPRARCSVPTRASGSVGEQRQAPARNAVPGLAPAAAASGGSPVSKGKHFLRPSLLATLRRGAVEPEHALQHCLAIFRKSRTDLAALRQYLPDSYADAMAPLPSSSSSSSSSSLPLSSLPHALPVGPWMQVGEQGPLAPLAGVLDVGARRVLPGHLLRRSKVLSTLRPTADTFQQRTELTACTGESSVFEWQLRWCHDAEGGEGWVEVQRGQLQRRRELQPAARLSSSSSSGDGSCGDGSSGDGSSSDGSSSSSGSGSSPGGSARGRWVIESVRRDASCDLPLPTTPHPTAAPEAVVKAQLAALQKADVLDASTFCAWRDQGGHRSSRRTGLGFHHESLRVKLAQQPFDSLLHHTAAQLGAAALPTQREMLQEVRVLSANGTSTHFVWRLGLRPQGCWMVTGIFPAEEAAARWQTEAH